ncbi:MAG: hypothetical protein PHT59_07880, partial [Candidatus Omnitrophica bacterium]|nr:hypothetical protein [Candidatus Omnitrophota bacterium]
EDMKTSQADRLYLLANSAFERGDYADAMSRLDDAELTYALETAQSFSLTSFLKRYSPQLVLVAIILTLASALIFVDVRFWMMDNELSQLANEENILVGLIKEVQVDYFERGRMSASEYTTSVEQYETRLGKIVQRRVELETEKQNFFTVRSRSVRLKQEKARLEELIRGLQTSYLQHGRLETRSYENRLKSYVSRMSEVEEAVAVSEAEERMKAERGIIKALFRRRPDAASAGQEEAKRQPEGTKEAPGRTQEEAKKETTGAGEKQPDVKKETAAPKQHDAKHDSRKPEKKK